MYYAHENPSLIACQQPKEAAEHLTNHLDNPLNTLFQLRKTPKLDKTGKVSGPGAVALLRCESLSLGSTLGLGTHDPRPQQKLLNILPYVCMYVYVCMRPQQLNSGKPIRRRLSFWFPNVGELGF